MVLGVALACGIGFTMSLFIAGLAFEPSGSFSGDRLGILIGSIASAILSYVCLASCLPKAGTAETQSASS